MALIFFRNDFQKMKTSSRLDIFTTRVIFSSDLFEVLNLLNSKVRMPNTSK